MVNSDDHRRVCTHTHLLHRQPPLPNAQILPSILERVGDPTQGTPCSPRELEGWTKSCRIQDLSSRISCHRWREREGTGGWENRGRDSVHLRMMPQTSQQGDLVAQIVDPSQRRVENDNIQWGSECMDRAWIMCIDRLCLRSCRNRTLILRWNRTTRAHRCPVWGFASTFGHVSLPCWPLG